MHHHRLLRPSQLLALLSLLLPILLLLLPTAQGFFFRTSSSSSSTKLYSSPSPLKHPRSRHISMSSQDKGSKAILFLCLGNICRSSSAEAVMKDLVEKKGKAAEFRIDSCGTGGGNPGWYREGGWSYHEGERADSRMRQAASKRGIDITSISRPLKPEDLDTFDLIVCMDGSNKSSVMEAADHWGKTQAATAKLRMMTDYCRVHKDQKKVPDPYYGGSDGFEKVLDLLEDACEGLYENL